MEEEDPPFEWSLDMMICNYTISPTAWQFRIYNAHVLGQINKKCVPGIKITHPPHPGHQFQYTIPTGMLRALSVLHCRAKEQNTASNGDWGAHVRVSTTLCSFQVTRYSWIEADHGRRGPTGWTHDKIPHDNWGLLGRNVSVCTTVLGCVRYYNRLRALLY